MSLSAPKRIVATWLPGVFVAAVTLFGFSNDTAFAAGRTRPVIPVHVTPVTTEPSRLVFFYEPSGDETKLLALQDSLLDSGAYQVNVFPPSHIACMLPEKVAAGAVASRTGAVAVEDRQLGASRVASALPGVDFYRQCYDLAKRLSHPEDEPFLKQPGAGAAERYRGPTFEAPPDEIVLRDPAPVASDEADAGETATRQYYQYSEFMVGKIVVNLILPESFGYQSREDWTPERLTQAEKGVVAALLSYQQQYPHASINLIIRTLEQATTWYEPIRVTVDDDNYWINDVLRRIDSKYYSPTEPSYVPVTKLDIDQLNYYRADWVFTIFICSAENAPYHVFAGERKSVSYSKFGGPYLACPFPPGDDEFHPDDSYRLSVYVQHEISRIFWGLDEGLYDKGDCHNRSGYLNHENKNKVDLIVIGGPANECKFNFQPCVMQEIYWSGGSICDYTAAHMGICDFNENGVPDVFDSSPVIDFVGGVAETLVVDTFTVRGTARSFPVHNQNSKQDSTTLIDYASPLKDAVMNINGFGNQYILPVDGRWDELEEDLEIPLRDLMVGMTIVDITVRNTAGFKSPPIIKKIFRAGLSYSFFSIDTAADGITLSWYTIGETFNANFELYRVNFANDPPDTILLATGLTPSGPPVEHFLPYSFCDTDVNRLETYGYFVRGTYRIAIQGGEPQTFVNDSRLSRVTVPLPIGEGAVISAFTPNPFSATTRFSIRVPHTFRNINPSSMEQGAHGPATSSGLITETPTPVEVTAYDVMGRYVATILRGSYFGTTISLSWDGTDDNNTPMPSGIYFLKMKLGDLTESKKVTILR